MHEQRKGEREAKRLGGDPNTPRYGGAAARGASRGDFPLVRPARALVRRWPCDRAAEHRCARETLLSKARVSWSSGGGRRAR
jgi:hypothetical protein